MLSLSHLHPHPPHLQAKQTTFLHTWVMPLHMVLPVPGIPFPPFRLVSTAHSEMSLPFTTGGEGGWGWP